VPETLQTRLQTLILDQTEALVDMALTSPSLTEFTDHLPAAGEIETSN